jgi:hypothetical protein
LTPAQKTEKPVLASAKVTGKAATALIAQIDDVDTKGAADVLKPATAKDSVKKTARTAAKPVKAVKTKATIKRKTKRTKS